MLIEHTPHGVVLSIYLQPKASQDKWLAVHNNELKLALTSPPVDGKANQHLIKFIAKQFSVAKTKVEITKGLTSRHKKVIIKQLDLIIPASLNTLLTS